MQDKLVRISKGNSKMGKIASVATSPCKGCVKGVPCAKKGECYAIKAYVQYPQTKFAYDNNLMLARDYRDLYFAQITAYCMHESFFRWHVSGDILDQDYLDRMILCAKQTPNCKHLCFTKNHALKYPKARSNLTIVFSMWPGFGDTKKKMPRAWMKDVENFDTRIPEKAIGCPGNCETCGMCWNLPEIGLDVVFDKH